jgi:hypothetical protein
MLLERLFTEPDPPHLVLYGLIELHEPRNVAHPLWLRIQASCTSRGFAGIPYCRLDATGKLQRHAPEVYNELPLHEFLATSVLAERAIMKLKTRERVAQKRAVSDELILEMDRLCRTNGAIFVVAYLKSNDDLEGGEPLSHYRQFSATHGIKFINCVHPCGDDMRVPGEWLHPNGKMNDLWVDDIDASLHDLLSSWKE